MGQRIYVTTIENVAIGTAVQDIFSLVTGASNGLELHYIRLEANVSAEAALRMRLKRGTATVTQGSGGTNQTPTALDANDGASSGITAHINDTTQATTTGAFTTLAGFQWDVALPFEFLPAPENRPTITVSQALILDLPATITSTTISGFIMYRQLP